MDLYFIKDGVGFAISNIVWQPAQGFSQGSDMLTTEPLFNAVVTYQGWHAIASIPSFRVRAVYDDVYCKGDLIPPHNTQGKRLICSGLAQFCGKGVVYVNAAA